MHGKIKSIQTMTLTETLTYENTPVLTYKISYPRFESKSDSIGLINTYYEAKAMGLAQESRNKLYPSAVSQYQFSKENNYPVMKYEILQTYTITYQSDYYLSLYLDQYVFTGGAHGNTTRYSDTWSLCSGNRVPLHAFYPSDPDYKQTVIANIDNQIAEQNYNSQDPSVYNETYTQDVCCAFNENNFYMTPDSLVIYFQQYDIAPYSSGIPQFFIPFVKEQ